MPESEKQSSGQDVVVPGKRWRLLAHEGEGSFEVENRGIIDEVVIDNWLHLEQMDEQEWWMRLGDARIWIYVEPTGVRIDVERGAYEKVRGDTRTHDPDRA
jgi:hypothetical protein